MSVILSANLQYLFDYSKKQFSQSKGLHLNSKDWEAHVSVGPARYYSFLINGDLKWQTTSAISGETYEQLLKLSDYKKIESALLVLYLLNVDESTIIKFLKLCFRNSNCRVFCPCKAFQFWGPHYNLTKVNSNYSKGENLPPDVRDPGRANLVCKHLWLVLNRFETEIDRFIKDLIPYYKRYFGINSPTGITRTQKELGEKGIKSLIFNAKTQILRLKNKEILDMYNSLVDSGNKLNNLFDDVVEVEQSNEPVKEERIPDVKQEEINQNVQEMSDEVNNEIDNDNNQVHADEPENTEPENTSDTTNEEQINDENIDEGNTQ